MFFRRRCRTYNMDRAFQLREQHLRRHRLILAIYFLALLVFVCIIVGLLVKYALGIKSARKDNEYNGLRIDGSWGDWKSWSDCSAPCEAGLQTRKRFCDDPAPENNGSHCDGIYHGSRICAAWPCPNCSRYCEKGFLRYCAYCKCLGTTLTGRVRGTDSMPLYGVSVFLRNMQWQAIDTTDPHGLFNLTNICREEFTLVFKKMGYRTALVNATTLVPESGGYMAVSLEKLRQPRLIEYPVDTVVFEGDTVILSCLSNSPHQTTYEWYKNANILSHPNDRPGMSSHSTANSQKLIIYNTREEDSGLYRCRVISNMGEKTFSNSALMNIVGAGEADTCKTGPLPKHIILPEGCHYGGDNNKLVDIGHCPAEVCRTRAVLGERIFRKCCGVTHTETIWIHCTNWDFPIVKVKACGCTLSCSTTYKIPVTGRTILRDPVFGTTEYLQTTYTHEGKEGITDEDGYFTLAVYSNQTRTVLSIPNNPFPKPSTSAIHVLLHPDSMYHFDILLQNQASPVRIESSQTMEFPVMSVGMSSPPVVSLTLPGDAVMDRAWNVYNGTMDVYTAFLDSRLEANILLIPGDFTYRSEEGEIYELKIYGVLIFYVLGSKENDIEINTNILVNIDTSKIDIPSERLQFWYLDHETARWRPCIAEILKDTEEPSEEDTMLRAKVEMAPGMQFVAVASSLPNRDRCEIMVAVYKDSNFTEPAPGQRVIITSKHSDIFIHMNDKLTGHYGSICIQVPCGCEHFISAPGAHTSSTHYLPSGLQYENSEDGRKVRFVTPEAKEIRPGGGPLHRYGGHTCSTRHTSSEMPYHFQFALDQCSRTDVPDLGTFSIEEHQYGLVNSWFDHSMDEAQLAVCTMKLVWRGVANDTDIIAVSRRAGQASDLYGSHITRTLAPDSSSGQRAETCVLVRCPVGGEEIEDKADSNLYHRVLVDIHIGFGSARECEIQNVTSHEGVEWTHKTQTVNQTFSMILSKTWVDESPPGFHMNRGNGRATKDWALLECSRLSQSAVQLECG